MISLSADTQATLLLTAPLITGDGETSTDLLTAGEYRKLRASLNKSNHTPADLLGDVRHLPPEIVALIDTERFQTLLSRGFQLTQAIERWQSRAVWVVSHTDKTYPQRLKNRLADNCPPILYGCGNSEILETGGLAIVGSRDVDPSLIEFTESIGRLTAQARRTVISGGARGIDQAAMRGALDVGGSVAGVLADSLERAVLTPEHRELLMDSRLVLISPYDPSAGFNVGHAMHRNKLIYALSDAALVVNSDYEKGGTWAGAVEQLDKLHFVPIYVRSNGEIGKGLEGLKRKGGLDWPNPSDYQSLEQILNGASEDNRVQAEQLSFLEM
jgi:DNA processing protein